MFLKNLRCPRDFDGTTSVEILPFCSHFHAKNDHERLDLVFGRSTAHHTHTDTCYTGYRLQRFTEIIGIWNLIVEFKPKSVILHGQFNSFLVKTR